MLFDALIAMFIAINDFIQFILPDWQISDSIYNVLLSGIQTFSSWNDCLPALEILYCFGAIVGFHLTHYVIILFVGKNRTPEL